jgi:hypothetical protein
LPLSTLLPLSAAFADSATPSIREKLYTLLVIPYDYKNKYLNKIILFNEDTKKGCSFSKKGKYTFADIEGASVNSLKEYIHIDSPSQAFDKKTPNYQNYIFEKAIAVKKQSCLDVNLAPVLDPGVSARYVFKNDYYYIRKNRKAIIDQHFLDVQYQARAPFLIEFMKGMQKGNMRIALKHYPFSIPVNMKQLPEQAHNMLKKWGKPKEKLSNNYSEIQIRRYKDSMEHSAFDNVKPSIVKTLQATDLIMLQNDLIWSAGFIPYIATDLPQNDPVLNAFPGLIISDDLYQLDIENLDPVPIFKNADLFILTDINDAFFFIDRLEKAIKQDEKLLGILNKKYFKVLKSFPYK